MNKFIYWTKEGIFETENQNEIPWDDLHSPDENTPALIWPNGIKEWFYEGKRHRLTGPAIIWPNGGKRFYLNEKHYEFKEWVHKHPNIDIYLEANGFTTNQEKALWKLKNF